MCPYKCPNCYVGDNYSGCARYKSATIHGIENVTDDRKVLDHGRLLELSK